MKQPSDPPVVDDLEEESRPPRSARDLRPSIVPVFSEPRVGLVLSGGGMHGAYEVGVVEGIVEALGPRTRAPFRVFAGTSVGAINATYLASQADHGDLGIGGLRDIWQRLRIQRHLKFDPLSFLSLRAGLRRSERSTEDQETLGTSLLDPRPLEAMIRGGIDWEQLHENLSSGHALALLIAALDVATGRTTIFSEVAPAADFRPTRDPRRVAQVGTITEEHVLASAAIPVVFPARRIGASYFCDGGLRFNTPIAPAIRAGADQLVVVTLTGQWPGGEEPVRLEQYPSLPFLFGKVLNALLLDPVVYDLQVLQRFNQLLEILEKTLPPASRAEVERLMIESRGAPYRQIRTLVFTPSEDLGRIATEHLQQNLDQWQLSRIPRWLLGVARRTSADWSAYVLFDGAFAAKLIDLGRRDALRRADEIREFFSMSGAGGDARLGVTA